MLTDGVPTERCTRLDEILNLFVGQVLAISLDHARGRFTPVATLRTRRSSLTAIVRISDSTRCTFRTVAGERNFESVATHAWTSACDTSDSRTLPVIAVPVRRRVLQVATRAAHYTERLALQLVGDEPGVTWVLQVLIAYLAARAGAVTARPGVDDLPTEVDIIFIPAADHDELRARRCRAADAALRRPVHTRLGHRPARRPP